ncbi:hypothetical protein DLAC_06762 [Tieghemostelium lacteum]|uniref:Serine aminopeptidase S33 domain-containing protein n=1 Tax=Tieghemostelium lacteum TaxID=361077 RepID=A0A151ZFM0_TIELA|nr:hypothetical protein DLAC_06762 [Tieghemostelium lacteum]|eukprot:KYQ92758.1 hypothetical protein DLAC_06762 [Tieghemostelium lacteum]
MENNIVIENSQQVNLVNYRQEILNILNVDLIIHIWEPPINVEEYRGVVLFLHGMGDHAGRFQHFAEYLVMNGYSCVIPDQRGHGRSIKNIASEMGHIYDKDCINVLADDAYQINQHLKNILPQRNTGMNSNDRKPIVIGFSMGSFISIVMMYKYPQLADHYVHLGTNCGSSFISKLSFQIIRLERFRLGKRGVSTILDDIGEKELNKAFKPQRTAIDYYTRDNDEIDKYQKDIYCNQSFDNQFWYDMMYCYNNTISDPKLKKLVPKNTTFLILSGSMDPIGYNGEGPKLFYKQLKNVGIENVQLKLYKDARHDLLHEINKQEVYQDILHYLNSRF